MRCFCIVFVYDGRALLWKVSHYLFGHGQAGTGGWCFEEPGATAHRVITYNDVAKRWHARKQQSESQKLYIIVDACFSGKWAVAAKQDASIVVQASTGENDLAVEDVSGGLWTVSWTSHVAALADARIPEEALMAAAPSSPLDATGQDCMMHASADASNAGQRWLVVAADGVVVREGASLYSKQKPPKLANGALVTELESRGARLHYSKASLGFGPSQGWITKRSNGKELIIKTDREPATAILFPTVLPKEEFAVMTATANLQEATSILDRERPGWNSKSNSWFMDTYLHGVVAWEKVLATIPHSADGCLILLPYGFADIFSALFAAGCLTCSQGLALALQLEQAISRSFGRLHAVVVYGMTEEVLNKCISQVTTECDATGYCAIDAHLNPLLFRVKCARELVPALADACNGNGALHVNAEGDFCDCTPLLHDYLHDFHAALDLMIPTFWSPKHVVWLPSSETPLRPGCSSLEVAEFLRHFLTHPLYHQKTVERSIQEDCVGAIYELCPERRYSELLSGLPWVKKAIHHI